MTELASATFSRGFGQIFRGDGDKARADNRRLLVRGAESNKRFAAAVATSKTRTVAQRSALKFMVVRGEPS